MRFLNRMAWTPQRAVAERQARRALCRPCLDWSERRIHLQALGAAIYRLSRPGLDPPRRGFARRDHHACGPSRLSRTVRCASRARSLRRPQTVADAGLGQNVAGQFRVRLDLAPKLPHGPAGSAHRQCRPASLATPGGEDASGVPDQRSQDVIFAWRQLDLLLARPDHPPHQIDRQSPTLKSASPPVPAADGAGHLDAGDQLVHAERLRP